MEKLGDFLAKKQHIHKREKEKKESDNKKEHKEKKEKKEHKEKKETDKEKGGSGNLSKTSIKDKEACGDYVRL
jgi:hypothetical protein